MAGVATKEVLRQVMLQSPTANGYYWDICWIRNDLAEVGKRVRDESGVVWTVTETYGAKSFHDVDAQREAWKRWSDVLDGH